jgi:type II secretory pathway component PulF
MSFNYYLFAKQMIFTADMRRECYEKMLYKLEDGFTEIKTLERLQTGAENADKSVLNRIYKDLLISVRSGQYSASEALALYVPPLERVALLSANNSDPAAGLRSALSVMTATGRLKSELRSKLMYPVMLVAALIAFLSFTGSDLIPVMLDIVPFERWDKNQILLHDLTIWFSKNTFIFTLSLVFFIVAMFVSFPLIHGRVRTYLDKLPFYSTYRDYSSAIFLSSLASQLAAGKSLKSALQSINVASPPYLSWHVSRMLINHRAAYQDADSLVNTGLFNRDLEADIRDYAGSSEFKSSMSRLSNRVIEATIKRVGLVASIVNGLAMIAVALGILWVYATMMGLTQMISSKTM